MNHYSFEEIEIGTIECFSIEITEEHMELFAKLSGDLNPMHVDAVYAQNRGYKDTVVYGMLSASFYSTLVGMYLPGERCLLNESNIIYRKPVYVGDRLYIQGKVVDKRNATRRIKIKGEMTNQEGVIVNTADIMVSFTSG